MNVAGLHNLGYAPKPKDSVKGTGSSKDAKKPAFDAVLERNQRRADGEDLSAHNDAPKRDDKAPLKNPEPKKPVAEKSAPAPAPAREPVAKSTARETAPTRAASAKTDAPARDTNEAPARDATPNANPEIKAKGQPTGPDAEVDAENLPNQNLPLVPGTANFSDRLAPAPAAGLKVPEQGKAGPATSPDDGVDSLTRRAVWNDFLRKMKDDLGVSAEDVLKAFSSLSTEELAKPPAQTVDSVVAALGLTGQQQAMAKQYFTQLIQKTQSPTMGDELKTSGKQINLSLMSQRDLEKKNMASGLERMNQNFFLKGPYARPLNMETSAQPNSISKDGQNDNAPVDVEDMDPRLLALTPNLGQDAAPALTVPATDTPTPGAQMPRAQDAKPGKGKAINDMTAQMKPASAQDRSVDQIVQKFIGAQATSGMAKAKTVGAAAPEMSAASSATPTPIVAPTAPSLGSGSLTSLLGGMPDGDVSDGDDNHGDSSQNSALTAALAGAGTKGSTALAGGADFKAQLSGNQANMPTTVPELVQQAQIMIKDGGGEMKVTMHPEGLGEVAMRVTVESGKVNVQMITESDETKRLIEHQLGELKSSLSASHLHVTDIKVDTASNLGKQLEQQYHEAQRQATQSNWEQFRQDNQGWRRSFFDSPSAKPYKGQADAQRDIQAPTSAQAANRSAGSRRLDLVA